MNSSFKRNLLILYGLSFLLLIVSAIASYSSINNLLNSQKLVNHTNLVKNNLESIISVLKDAETGQRGFLLTGKDEFLEPYNGALRKAYGLIDETKILTADNSLQQKSAEDLRNIIKLRMSVLETLIDNKRRGNEPTLQQLETGKLYMDQARQLVQTMQNRENDLLASRTKSLNKFASSTPTLIIIASLLSFVVALISFLRVNTDFDKRTKLQMELIEKDEDTTKRLNLIQNIAEKISSGDYKTRVSDEGKDVLGNLSGSLNKMAESLDYSFTNLSHNEWLQTGIAGLNDKMLGEKNLKTLTYNIIGFIAAYTQSPVAAFYLAEDDQKLCLSAGIALDETKIKKEIKIGEDLAGQSALSGTQVLLEDINEASLFISFSSGAIRPKSIIAVPVFYEQKLKGVLELASLKDFNSVTKDFLKASAYNIGLAIHSARDHQRLEELLAETQAQSEELQMQHNEMENINAELEVQAEKLQASEEELKVQQEELQQSNLELEERSRLLEEKNELILERNLQIQSKAEQLELTTKYKSEFLANMSHELRTPLNSILLLSRLLSENHGNNLNNDQLEYATVIQNSGTSLLMLINEILDLSKIESGKIELDYSDVTIKDLVNEIDALFEPVAKDKDILFKIEVDKNVQDQIETDRLRLEQILRNLISNALKFTKQGSVIVNITTNNQYVSFAVKDTGIGIPADKQEIIFEAFQQADGSTKRQYGGTGLGLSISRELAKLLSGEIIVHSIEGKGSEFILTIPLKKNDTYTSAEDKTVVKNISDTATSSFTQTQHKEFIADIVPASIPDDRDNIQKEDKVILIIEDDTAFARSLLDFTRQKSYKGIVAVRGDEGVELAQKYHPNGILLDIQLPVKSGWQVMDDLKSNAQTRSIPVHIMSSHEVKNKSLLSGAVDFINKPVAFEKMSSIFQKIEDVLSRHPKKVLIVEENAKHAQALAYFLEGFNVSAEIKNSIGDGIKALNEKDVDCVILDMGIPAQGSYDTLEEVRKTPGLENLPIIIFTGKNLSTTEEMRIKQYADSIVVKTAHSYQRILDEVSLFLHLVEENKKDKKAPKYKRMGELTEVLKGKTVLIADDDVRNIFSLTKSLENYDMNVISAIDGKDALKQLAANKNVDVVLMDMMMPEMDGYESTRRIRENSKYKNLPIIAVTAKAMMGDREKCINAGASDYITKPVDADQLISLLRVWLYQ